VADEKIRLSEAGPGDLPAITALLSRRDERENDPEDVRRVLFGLEPDRLRAWVAWAGERPVGLTAIYLRRLRWQEGTRLAGYWAHLYVHEDYRERMVFPMLLLAMVRGARAAGVEVMFTATRQPGLATASAKLGFALLATRRVLLRPLRPLRLAGLQLGAPRRIASLGAPLDALFGALATRVPAPPGDRIEVLTPAEGAAAAVALLEKAGCGRISQIWSDAYFRRRFEVTIDGAGYELLLASRDGAARAAVITRLSDRNNGVRSGVILDALAADDDAAGSLAHLLRVAHRRAYEAGAELCLGFDAPGTGFAALARRLGYREVWERYHFLVWPAEVAAGGGFGSDPDHWRFAFADHDAF